MRYHISKNGEAGVCRAKTKPCPLGEGAPHFGTIDEARKASEEILSKVSGNFSSLSKNNIPGVVSAPVMISEEHSKIADELAEVASNMVADIELRERRGEVIPDDVKERALSFKDSAMKHAGVAYYLHEDSVSAETAQGPDDYMQRIINVMRKEDELQKIRGSITGLRSLRKPSKSFYSHRVTEESMKSIMNINQLEGQHEALKLSVDDFVKVAHENADYLASDNLPESNKLAQELKNISLNVKLSLEKEKEILSQDISDDEKVVQLDVVQSRTEQEFNKAADAYNKMIERTF